MTLEQYIKQYGIKTTSAVLRDLMLKADVKGNDSVIIRVMADQLEEALAEYLSLRNK